VEVVAVGVLDPERVGQAGADRRLSRTRHPHHDDHRYIVHSNLLPLWRRICRARGLVIGNNLAAEHFVPELFDTLREHIRNDFNRRRTSRTMYLHPNTVDHRLKRIGRLTGLDTAVPHVLYRLRAALIARTYARPESPTPGEHRTPAAGESR
jgi:sugar diacid utilization regulator